MSYGFDGGFDRGFDMFNAMSFIMPVFFLLFAGVFVFIIIKNIGQWNQNNNQPVLTVECKVVGKRTEVWGSEGSHTNYYVTFEVESGDRMELYAPARDYGLIAEGDRGKLTFQGTRYKSFERHY